MGYGEEKRVPRGAVIITFWPSLDEIEDDSLENGYSAGLTGFYKSLEELLRENQVAWSQAPTAVRGGMPRLTTYTDNHRERGSPVARFAPPELSDFLFWLGTSGTGAAVYSLLRLWVQDRNGRKLRVKVGGIEVEATQLKPEQFEEIFDFLRRREKEGKRIEATEVARFLKSHGLKAVDASQAAEDERHHDRLRSAVLARRHAAEQKRLKRLKKRKPNVST